MASTDTQPMDKLKDVSRPDEGPGRQGDEHRLRQGRRADRQARGHRRRQARWQGAQGGRQGRRRGRLPGHGRSQGRRLRRQGQDHRWRRAGAAVRKATKSTNIIETIDVGVPVSVAYNQWTEFGAFPSFMKKVESVEAEDDNKLDVQGPDLLVPPHVGGHDPRAGPRRAHRVEVQGREGPRRRRGHLPRARPQPDPDPGRPGVLPQGLFERTGNIWRAQGRRARAELRHFRRHVMTRTILDPDEVEGWRGVIEDGEVVKTHEEVVEEEEQEQEPRRGVRRGRRGRVRRAEGDEADEESEEEPEDEYDDEAPRTKSLRTSEDEDVEDEYEEPAEESRRGRGRRGGARGRVRGRGPRRRGRGRGC